VSRGALAIVALALAATVAGPVAVASAAAPNFPVVENEYMCVTCNVPLPEAESPQADRERALIRRLIAQGDTDAQIRHAMVATYTDKVLQLPPRSGFNLVAYIVPVAAVIALVAALLFVLPRWRRRPPPTPPPTSPLPDADSVRLDADLARFDV
jgi:cytochrome c-type biogenesis protein CcmH